MKQNIYYRSVFGRNVVNQAVVPLILLFLGYPKLVLEVFLRRNMGERYFSLFWAAVIGVALWVPPLKFGSGFASYYLGFAYYPFAIAYAIMTVVRYLEIRRLPSVFDFQRFSLSTGRPYDFFFRIRLFGKPATMRQIEIFYEPLFCLAIGLVLFVMDQKIVAAFIIFCALCYSLSSYMLAVRGDHFIMDKIDEIIFNQDMSETFVQNKEVSPRGTRYYGQKPSSEALRRDFAEAVQDDDDDDRGGAKVF